MRGIFRIRQSKRVDQLITFPQDDKSWKMLHKMINIAKKFCKLLSIPYSLVCIVSVTLNDMAAKKLDHEAWFLSSGAYRDLISCNNCLDYKARRL